jgi:thiosulfate/3-mercaptopyruvate sulfurtransferase
LERPIATSCSLGIGASTLALVMSVVGRSDAAVFDGAWEVWGSHLDTPKERG